MDPEKERDMTTDENYTPMTATDLARLGMNFVAYVKPVLVEDETRFAICAADGTQMGLAPNRDVAFAAIRQHELEPLSVH
jgi:hypothetical protein